MKHQLTLILIFILQLAHAQDEYKALFGDSIKEINWLCSISYLPSFQSEHTMLVAKPGKLKAEQAQYKIRKRHVREIKTKINISESKFIEIYNLYNQLNQPYVNFALTQADKDSLRSYLKDTSYIGFPIYKLSEAQLESYIQGDSIQVDMSVFKIDSVNNLLGLRVIDGAPFYITFQTISILNDTTEFEYHGNLFGGDDYRDYAKHLLFSSINANTNLFKDLPLEVYFSRENFLRILIKYMEGNEGLLEFKPYMFLLKED